MEAAPGAFTRPPDFDALAFLQRTLALTPARVEVRVPPALTQAQARACVPPALAVLEPDGETASWLHCWVEQLDWFAAWLIQLGRLLRVETPPELRAAFADLAVRASEVATEGQGWSSVRSNREYHWVTGHLKPLLRQVGLGHASTLMWQTQLAH